MVDVDTFLTILYVMADDFFKTTLPSESYPGPQAALSRSEVVTLALFGLSVSAHPGAGQPASPPAARGPRGILSASCPAFGRPALCL